jgi:hypothetical protein
MVLLSQLPTIKQVMGDSKTGVLSLKFCLINQNVKKK